MMLSIGVNSDTELFDLLPDSEDKVTWLNNAINISLLLMLVRMMTIQFQMVLTINAAIGAILT